LLYYHDALFQLTLPKFKLEDTLKLHKIFPDMGVVDVFQSGKADLSGISKSTPDLYVDQVMHKAVLEVRCIFILISGMFSWCYPTPSDG